MPGYRREDRAMPLYISIRIKFYNGVARFLCTARLCCTVLHQRPFKCWNYTQYADFHGETRR